MYGTLPIGQRESCSSHSVAQQVPMADIPGMLWRIHSKARRFVFCFFFLPRLGRTMRKRGTVYGLLSSTVLVEELLERLT